MWLRRFSRLGPLALLPALLLGACSGMLDRSSPADSSGASAGGSTTSAARAGGGSAPLDAPAQAAAEFERAVGLLQSGEIAEAELEFQQLAARYPELAGPLINLGIIHRKADRLEQSEQALRSAVERREANAVAWSELGVTLRMRGKFHEAADAYRRAIAADPQFAPAYRNLGVLLDLYVGDAEGALEAFERYKVLSGEERPVSGWIAELRQRTGRAPISRPAGSALDPQQPRSAAGEGGE